MASPKIKHAKPVRIISDSVVRGRLSENYLTRKFIARYICNAKYSRITVYYYVQGYIFIMMHALQCKEVCVEIQDDYLKELRDLSEVSQYTVNPEIYA